MHCSKTGASSLLWQCLSGASWKLVWRQCGPKQLPMEGMKECVWSDGDTRIWPRSPHGFAHERALPTSTCPGDPVAAANEMHA